MTLALHELRLARRLIHAPAFSHHALVLTLGIGATTALFSIVNGVCCSARCRTGRPAGEPAHSIVVPASPVDQSDATFLLYQRHNTVFDGIGSFRETK